jgi:hypothetical protein
MIKLTDALERSRQMIREALADARAELETLRERQAELESQIAEAEAALGDASPATLGGTMTLHHALAQVLREGKNAGMTARELADTVNDRALYRKRDGSPVQTNQVQARVNNYRDVFEKDGPTIRLREESPILAAAAPGFMIFRDDDGAFFDWLEENPEGYFINTERNPSPTFLVLHRSQCPHFKGGGDVHWTKNTVKVCSDAQAALEEWAANTVGGEVTLCRSCFGGD